MKPPLRFEGNQKPENQGSKEPGGPYRAGEPAPEPPVLKPKDLPRETQVVRVPDEERVCPVCGKGKQVIGHLVSEVLDFVSAHFKVIEEHREKLACPDGCETSVSVAPSEKVYDRGRPGPALLATCW